MRPLRCSLLIVYYFCLSAVAISQGVERNSIQVYGLDQTLYNGKRYNFTAPAGTTGNPFLNSPLFTVGKVKIKEKIYGNINLNYDIYNQQLLLQYSDGKRFLNIIEVSKAWLQSFSLGNRNFELLLLEQEPRFYQVIGEGPIKILYYWRKTLELNNVVGATNFVFSKALRDSYLLKDGQIKPFKSKKNLVQIFPQWQQPLIKNYLRKNKINLKKASDPIMSALITYISNIKE